VTQHTRRFIRCFWALDADLANARHYPSIHWLHSYSDYVEDVSASWETWAPDWGQLRTEALTLLQREERLQQIVKLVGPDVLPETQRLILFIAELLKDGFLTQSAYDERDMYCSPERQVALLRIILGFHQRGRELLQAGVALDKLRALPSVAQIVRAKSTWGNSELTGLGQFEQRLREELDSLSTKTEGGPG
jgi:V/A-type H+-transporting ATPase subunit A